jgi:hypothetical protein
MLKIFFVIIAAAHGLIHLMGFVKAYGIAELPQLTQPVSKLSGIAWLACTVFFLTALALLLLNNDSWWIPGIAAVIISQVLIIIYWGDAKFGTIANIIISIPVLISLVNISPDSYKNVFIKESKAGIARYSAQPPVTEKDLEHLPKPVQKYLKNAGVVGKPRVQNLRVEFNAKMKMNQDSGWNDASAVQYEFFDKPARLFYMVMNMYGIPFEGLHAYIGPKAVMKIKAAKLIPVVNAEGADMNKGETVTLFNDMCLMAPATLIDKKIKWETLDEKTVKAVFTNEGNTISATLYFNEKGELVNFISKDRSMSSDGKIYKYYPWKTPVLGYKIFDGIKIASVGEAVWETETGDFAYGHFEIKNIQYNTGSYR